MCKALENLAKNSRRGGRQERKARLYSLGIQRQKETASALTKMFDQETAVEMYVKSLEKSAEERGERRGERRAERRAEKRGDIARVRRIARNLSDMGMPIDKIAQAAETSTDTVRKWLSGKPSGTSAATKKVRTRV